MKKHPLIVYFGILIIISTAILFTINSLGQKGLYLAQVYMMAPALAALLTRAFFYENKFSDAFLKLGKWKFFLQFWLISIALAFVSYLFYTLFGAVKWDFSGQSFLNRLTEQFAQSGQKMEDTLPKGFTPQNMITLYVIGNFTIFNILPGLITGFGEEFGHRGFMFYQMAKKDLMFALIVGGTFWFLWHLPLGLVLPMKNSFSTKELITNEIILMTGTICTHIYLSYVFMKTKSIWVAALAHITFNNVSAALGFFVVIQNQTLANLGLVLTMVIAVIFGFASGKFRATFNTYG